VGEEFGLVRRHVHPGGAVARAGLAGEAQVERRADVLRTPPFLDAPCTPDHVLQHSCATTCGVRLVAGGSEARAHDPTPIRAAAAHTDAPLHGVRPRVRTGLAGFAGTQGEVGAPLAGGDSVERQLGVHGTGLCDGARIEQTRAVPDPPELLERGHHGGGVHDGKEFRSRPTVPVLP
jgi:hypothetical protein